MPITKLPNGLQATPLIGGVSDFAGWFGTNVWYVDGDNGSDDQTTGDMETPFATIQNAIDAASAGDTIYVRALGYGSDASDPDQYAEDLTIAYAKHDLKIIGVNSSGTKMPYAGPKIKNSADAAAVALLTVNAPGVHLENLQFNCTRNSGTYGIVFNGVAGYATLAGSVGFTMVNCFIKNGSTTYYGVTITGGYGGVISNCTFQGCVRGINLSGSVIPSSGHTIEWCNFKGVNNATIASHIDIPAGSAHDWTIDHCNFGGTSTKFIVMGGTGVSGVISNCGFMDETTTTLAQSSGKIEIPSANDTVGVVACWGGGGELIVADGG